MTNHRDPIEDWLSRDVELLPPPQGAFHRVRRRARRRKAVQAMGAAAAAAVVVAAAVSLPQLAGNLFSGPTGPAKFSTGTPRPATKNSGNPTSHTPHPTATTHLPPLSGAGQGAKPPAGFSPTSVTFINGGRLGAVIGQGGPSCGPIPCTRVAATNDYGKRWTEIAGPRAGPPSGDAGVSQLRFADAQNGWAFGPALFATHDGGLVWKPVVTAGQVVDLATVGGRVLAVEATGCTGSGAGYAAGCTNFTLWTAAASGSRWTEVSGGPGAVVPGGLQLSGRYGYLFAAGRLYSGPLGGGWRTVNVAAASRVTPPCLTGHAGRGLIAPTPTSSPKSGTLYLACTAAAGQRTRLYSSGDGGRTWRETGNIPVAANAAATSLAVSPGGPLVLATTSGIYYSVDGSSWRRVADGAFRFVGMTTFNLGAAVPATSGLHEVFVTRDGGRTWLATPIG